MEQMEHERRVRHFRVETEQACAHLIRSSISFIILNRKTIYCDVFCLDTQCHFYYSPTHKKLSSYHSEERSGLFCRGDWRAEFSSIFFRIQPRLSPIASLEKQKNHLPIPTARENDFHAIVCEGIALRPENPGCGGGARSFVCLMLGTKEGMRCGW